MTDPVWLAEAKTFNGVHEGIGTLDNPVIMGWAKELGGWYAPFYSKDEIPWCGLFVGAMIRRAMPTVSLPKKRAGSAELV